MNSRFLCFDIWRMRSLFLAWTEEILAQPAREIDGVNLPRAVAEFSGKDPSQPVREISWSHNPILIEPLSKRLQGRLPSVEKIEKELGYGG